MMPSDAPRPTTSSLCGFGQPDGWDAAIVVSARDEQRRIARCLDAAALAIGREGRLKVGIIVVVTAALEPPRTGGVLADVVRYTAVGGDAAQGRGCCGLPG